MLRIDGEHAAVYFPESGLEEEIKATTTPNMWEDRYETRMENFIIIALFGSNLREIIDENRGRRKNFRIE